MKYLRNSLFTALLLVTSPFVNAALLEFTPINQTVDQGDSVEVELTVSGLGEFTADSLGAFDIEVLFDNSILEFSSVTYGDPVFGDQLDLFGLGSMIETTPGAGEVNLVEISLDLPFELDDLQLGSFTLATLSFDTLLAGTSSLDIGDHILSDASGVGLNADITQASVTVNAVSVPEPSILVLMGAGLLGLSFTSRRKSYS